MGQLISVAPSDLPITYLPIVASVPQLCRRHCVSSPRQANQHQSQMLLVHRVIESTVCRCLARGRAAEPTRAGDGARRADSGTRWRVTPGRDTIT